MGNKKRGFFHETFIHMPTRYELEVARKERSDRSEAHRANIFTWAAHTAYRGYREELDLQKIRRTSAFNVAADLVDKAVRAARSEGRMIDPYADRLIITTPLTSGAGRFTLDTHDLGGAPFRFEAQPGSVRPVPEGVSLTSQWAEVEDDVRYRLFASQFKLPEHMKRSLVALKKADESRTWKENYSDEHSFTYEGSEADRDSRTFRIYEESEQRRFVEKRVQSVATELRARNDIHRRTAAAVQAVLGPLIRAAVLDAHSKGVEIDPFAEQFAFNAHSDTVGLTLTNVSGVRFDFQDTRATLAVPDGGYVHLVWPALETAARRRIAAVQVVADVAVALDPAAAQARAEEVVAAQAKREVRIESNIEAWIETVSGELYDQGLRPVSIDVSLGGPDQSRLLFEGTDADGAVASVGSLPNGPHFTLEALSVAPSDEVLARLRNGVLDAFDNNAAHLERDVEDRAERREWLASDDDEWLL